MSFKFPKILAIMLQGGVIPPGHALDVVPGAIDCIADLVRRRVFTRILLIGDPEKEIDDHDWVKKTDFIHVVGMKHYDLRFYATEDLLSQFMRTHVTHVAGIQHDLAERLPTPTIRDIYILGPIPPSPSQTTNQAVHWLKGGWKSFHKENFQ